jgi:hypothetical protein
MAAAYLTRTAALPIIAAVMAWLAIERRWRQLAIFAVLALPAMAWWSYWTHAHAATNDYGNQFWYLDVYAPDLGRATPTQLLARIPANISAYGGAMIPLLFRGARGPMVFGISILVFAFAGWVLRLRRPGLSEFVFPFYGGMLLLCPPPWAGERYMLPIVPLALVYAFEAGQWMIRRARASMLMPAAGLVTAALLMVEGGSLVQRSTQASICRGGYRAGFPYSCLPPAWQDYLSIADWAETGLPADAVVISRKPGLFFALSNRRGIDIPKTSDPRKFFSIAAESAAEYLVLDRVDYLTTFYTVPVVAAYTRSFCVVRPGATEGTAVLRVLLDRPLAPTPAGEPPYVQPCDTPPKISNAS